MAMRPPFPMTREQAQQAADQMNWAVAFPLMGFRTLAPNPYNHVVGAIENITRPWSGVYKGPVEAGRTALPSYTQPTTYELTPMAEDAAARLLKLLGVTR